MPRVASRRLGFHSPILFISASDDVSKKIEGFEIGGVDYITKPIIGAEVIARVRTHLCLKKALTTEFAGPLNLPAEIGRAWIRLQIGDEGPGFAWRKMVQR